MPMRGSARRGECSREHFRSASDPGCEMGRSIGRDFVTGVLQTAFHCPPEGRVVVDNMHQARASRPSYRFALPPSGDGTCGSRRAFGSVTGHGAKRLGASAVALIPTVISRLRHSRSSRSITRWASITRWDGAEFSIVPGGRLCSREIPPRTFDRDWWVVGVAMDRGAIRHDLFPKPELLRMNKSCERWYVARSSTHMSEDIERDTSV